jgi:hypothetical protein
MKISIVQNIGGGMAKWLTHQSSNLRIAHCVGSKPHQGQAIVSVSKKLCTHCLVPGTD